MSKCNQASSPAPLARTYPWLPTEIIEKIMFTFWLSNLPNADRIQFMTSSMLVNTMWMSVYSKMSARDAFIPCRAYLSHFRNLVEERSCIFGPGIHSGRMNALCRSLTFRIELSSEHTPKPDATVVTDIGESIFDLLYYICGIPTCLPLLRRISIQYVNCGFTDLFVGHRLVNFPPQVTHLQIEFESDETRRRQYHEEMGRYDTLHGRVMWSLPNVRHLSIFGAGQSSVLPQLVPACYQVETIETDLELSLTRVAHLPDSLHTLVVRPPPHRGDSLCTTKVVGGQPVTMLTASRPLL